MKDPFDEGVITFLYFKKYVEYEEGIKLGYFSTIDGKVDLIMEASKGSDLDLKPGDLCDVEINAIATIKERYITKEDYKEAHPKDDIESFIPIGNIRDDFFPGIKPTPVCLFSGTVLYGDEGHVVGTETNTFIVVRIKDITIKMYIDLAKLPVTTSFIVVGKAQLYGVIKTHKTNA